MKQVLQNFRSGELSVYDLPRPALSDEAVLVANKYSAISPGTERSTTEFARKNLLANAREHPDLAHKVIHKIKHAGLLSAIQKSMAHLDQLSPLGYNSAGVVLETGGQVTDFPTGQKVACAEADYACHAQIIAVPRNLCVCVPDAVLLESACFVTLGAIAMHGVCNAQCSFGDDVAVIGLETRPERGLLGGANRLICVRAMMK